MKRCDERARKGTGEGICDRPLDRYGHPTATLDSDELAVVQREHQEQVARMRKELNT